MVAAAAGLRAVTRKAADEEVARYRPNILVDGRESASNLSPFEEDAWREVQLGSMRFSVDGATLYFQSQPRCAVCGGGKVGTGVDCGLLIEFCAGK